MMIGPLSVHQVYQLFLLTAVVNFIFLLVVKVSVKKKNYGIIWEFFPTWGGGLPNSQNSKPKKCS